MKINSYGFMPATFNYATNKFKITYGQEYVVCSLTALDGEGYRRYVLKEVADKLVEGQKYLFTFNIEAKSHNVYIIGEYPVNSLVSVERRD